jgi:site-specific DNA-methyltransferase (adenine-specific)
LASRVINKEIEQVAIDLLKHHPRNANNGDVEAIKKSLAVNGWYGSVVANLSTKHILAGNHRVMAAKALGWETVPVQWVDVTPEEELRILVVDNRTTRIGQDDTTKITDILAELANTPIGLEGTGYGAADLDALIDELAGMTEPAELLTDPDEVPEDVETRCKPGDLWILGRHRLLCGDSAKLDDVQRLIDCDTVDLLLTDPPYGINADRQHFEGHGWTLREKTEWDKERPSREVIHQSLAVTSEQIIWGGNYFFDYLTPSMGWLVWDKGQRDFSLADGEFAWRSERKAARIFSYSRAKSNREERHHPTQKPVALMAWCIELCNEAKTIYDPFLGSGTTLIAAEQLGRKCYGMEISPKYCDVIIQRWENATGQKAVLDGR